MIKEIQLLKPDKFKYIFLGMGEFHTEKVSSCLSWKRFGEN